MFIIVYIWHSLTFLQVDCLLQNGSLTFQSYRVKLYHMYPPHPTTQIHPVPPMPSDLNSSFPSWNPAEKIQEYQNESEWIEMDHQDTIINDQTSSNIIKHGLKKIYVKTYSMLANFHNLNSKESRKSLLSVWSASPSSSFAYMKQGGQGGAKLSLSHKHKQIHSRMWMLKIVSIYLILYIYIYIYIYYLSLSHYISAYLSTASTKWICMD